MDVLLKCEQGTFYEEIQGDWLVNLRIVEVGRAVPALLRKGGEIKVGG